MKNYYDVVIIGSGVAGCFSALHLPKEMDICMVTKEQLNKSDSFLAQGGICVETSADDYEAFMEDTLKAGHYENDRESVDMMITSSAEVIGELIDYGVAFETRDGELLYTKEGGHSKPRILHFKDETGKAITHTLLVKTLENRHVRVFEETTMVDLLVKDERCIGVQIESPDGSLNLYSKFVILATGGVGGLYEHSTNYRHLTGDGIAIAMAHGVAMKDLSYVQIHPTTLYSEEPGRRFLISEAVRGEGGILLNKDGERFTDELKPRDVVSKAIHEQMEKDNLPYVFLSFAEIETDVKERFPAIYERCLREGYDITKEPIKVVPAQHYYMGGIKIDLEGRTSLECLYAAGEAACNGVHGANRLASNSLLESLVFAKRAALDIAAREDTFKPVFLSSKEYQDGRELLEERREKLKGVLRNE
ncbi:L-aspartate oxidase [Lachnospiraceae bacterium PM6-15]|uniref:L-aspartate oxidase n=1 Tax=Ohessyouella blattaphilus TaxID=2949333 RepID=UPI003E1BF50E